jgi:hypothetical protein
MAAAGSTAHPTPASAGASSGDPRVLAVGASARLGSTALADIQQAWRAVDESGFGRLALNEERILPTTCQDWSVLKKRGFSPENTLERQADSGALIRCGSLDFLARAVPARVSYVQNLLEAAQPRLLPAILATAPSEDAALARAAAADKGVSLAQLVPDAKLVKSPLRGQMRVEEPTSETSITLNKEAWGDINADGTEDLLISVLNAANKGSYFEARLMALTRATPEAPVTVLATWP